MDCTIKELFRRLKVYLMSFQSYTKQCTNVMGDFFTFYNNSFTI